MLSYPPTDEDRIGRDVITFPLRVGVCATRVGIRFTERAVTAALHATSQLIGSAVAQGPNGAPTEDGHAARALTADVVIVSQPPARGTPSPPRPAPSGAGEAIRQPAPAVRPRTGTARIADSTRMTEPPPPAVPEFGPAHVSEGLQFVEAFAERGAEEGAGAAVHVEEPWKGYARMTADQLIARLEHASAEELAAVTLYEGSHRRRRTVLAAADRQLRRAAAAARQSG